MRVLIAPDKFKGTLTAAEAAEAIRRGWSRARPQDTLETLPISDGGDGFGPVMADFWGAAERWVETVDAAGRPRRARWWWVEGERKAIVETAQVVGLALLPPKQFHPFDLDTRGLGPFLQTIAASGAREVLAGIGGSATNDGGFGMARALGWRFMDGAGRNIERWTDLTRLERLEPPTAGAMPSVRWTVAVDVQNLFLGPQGASRVYGPQKGLKPEDMAPAEAALGQLAAVSERTLGVDHATKPGTGAAGGLGFGLAAFLGAELRPGFQIVAAEAGLERRIQQVDLVVAAEGAMDASTAMGKGAGELARLCQKHGIPCVGLAGYISPEFNRLGTETGFRGVHGICPHLTSSEDAMNRPQHWLETLSERVACGDPLV